MVPSEYSSEAPNALRKPGQPRHWHGTRRAPAPGVVEIGRPGFSSPISVSKEQARALPHALTPPQRRTARHTSVQDGRHDALRALRRLARGEDRAPRALRHEGARRSDDSDEADGRVRARGSPVHRRVRGARSRRHLLRQVRLPMFSHDRNRARHTTSATAIPRDGCGGPVGNERCALLTGWIT